MRIIQVLSYSPVDLDHLLCAGDDGACDVPRGGPEGMSQRKDRLWLDRYIIAMMTRMMPVTGMRMMSYRHTSNKARRHTTMVRHFPG